MLIKGDRILLRRINSNFLISSLRNQISSVLEFSTLKNVNSFSNKIILATLCICVFLALAVSSMPNLWYTRVVLIIVSLFSPFYILGLILDMYRDNINRKIPLLIDEFRSAFTEHQKVKLALKHSCLHIDRSIARIINEAVDDVNIDKSLIALKDRFDNIWFNIFVSLLINYKENGGDLVSQLYRLNSTITRHNTLEKKKSKRLFMYELFALLSTFFCIPASNTINKIFVGEMFMGSMDTESSYLLCLLAISSMVALITLRTLRKC